MLVIIFSDDQYAKAVRAVKRGRDGSRDGFLRRSGTLYDQHHVLKRRVKPWPEDHKARTREKIVQAAAAAFRAGGVAGVRLEDVMARAALTHGGFYAHFASKEELLREALEHAS